MRGVKGHSGEGVSGLTGVRADVLQTGLFDGVLFPSGVRNHRIVELPRVSAGRNGLGYAGQVDGLVELHGILSIHLRVRWAVWHWRDGSQYLHYSNTGKPAVTMKAER